MQLFAAGRGLLSCRKPVTAGLEDPLLLHKGHLLLLEGWGDVWATSAGTTVRTIDEISAPTALHYVSGPQTYHAFCFSTLGHQGWSGDSKGWGACDAAPHSIQALSEVTLKHGAGDKPKHHR